MLTIESTGNNNKEDSDFFLLTHFTVLTGNYEASLCYIISTLDVPISSLLTHKSDD